MDLIQLKRFLVAAEAGNLRRAAALLHVSQPALTQSIKGLEAMLGVELFERSARGVALTPFGKALVPRARMMLNERERIAREVRGEVLAALGVKVDDVRLWPVGAIPRTTSGKIQRRACARRFDEEGARP